MFRGTIDSPDRIVKDSSLKGYIDASQLRSWPRTGTTVSNLFGTAPAATLTNGVGSNNNYGGAFTFDGTNDYIDMGLALDNYYTAGGGLTAGIWFNYDTTNLGSMCLYQIYEPSANNNPWTAHLRLDIGGGIISFYASVVMANSSSINCSSGNVVSRYTPYYVCLVWNNSTGVLGVYLNGSTLVASVTGSAQGLLCFNYFKQSLGLTQTGLVQYAGTIYSAHFYNRALTASEMLQNYTVGKTRFGL